MFHTTSDGQKIFYRKISNKKSPIIFLHGLAENHTVFEYQSKALKDHSQILIDLRGHGQSSKPLEKSYYSSERMLEDVREIIKKEKLKNYSVIGFSFGGYLALQLSAAKSVIVINPLFGRHSLKKYFKVMFWFSQFIPLRILKFFEKTSELSDYAGLFDAYVTRRILTPPYVDMNIMNNVLKIEEMHICKKYSLITSDCDELLHDAPVGMFEQYFIRGHHAVLAENPTAVNEILLKILA